VRCRYAGDAEFVVSVGPIPAGIKEVQVLISHLSLLYSWFPRLLESSGIPPFFKGVENTGNE